ncbi:reverse transcriptase domain-containing protein [Tanacetum coccineum]|uniref:Reverse transcriptase domain-containing protein n=1 Tax=Tanacetum coccineum TaxID=301880 RepID=A0ABQ5ATH9_9ASTR
MHLRRQIEELIKNGKLSHVIKELKQGSGKDQPKAAKKGETSGKDKPLAILMVQPWQRPMGQISLPVKIGDAEHFTSTWMNFVVVRSSSSYNGIIERSGVRKIQVVPSTAHGKLKFPVPRGILSLRSSKIIPLECTMVSGPEAQPSNVIQAADERINVAIHPEYPKQTIAIGSTLTEEGRKALVSRHIAEHRLNVREGYSPVRQKKRSQAPERNKAIQEEVEKLVDASIMKEVHYHKCQSDLPASGRQSVPKSNWQKSEGRSYVKSAIHKVSKRRTKAEWKLASLNRFLSKSAEKSLPFFKTLKKCTRKSDFQWTAEAEVGFKQMKKLIAGLPTLTAPMEKEELIVYLAAAREAVSAVLMTKRGRSKCQSTLLAMPYGFDATNNEAEYKSLIAGLRITEQMGVQNLQTNVDSHLVANQGNRSYIAKESGMVQYLEKVKALASSFKKFSIKQYACWDKICGSKGHTDGILLANNACGCKKDDKGMSRLPGSPPRAKKPWIEAKPVTTITGIQIKKFVLDNIVCRFALPGNIISDNGKQFRDNPFKDWCEKLCIRQYFASVKHPQASGLVERENKSLGEGIKARLDERSKD